MKIALIGGGSVQWTMKLVTNIALNATLADADLVGERCSHWTSNSPG